MYLDYQQKIAEMTLQVIKEYRVKKEKIERTYTLDIVEDILKNSHQPLHISEIISIAKEHYDISLQRDSLSSSLAKKIKQGQRFVRTAPNTFYLIEEEGLKK